MSDMNTDEEGQSLNKKPTKAEILKAFKADLAAADSLRLEMVAKVDSWRQEYHGKPYGNEEKGKSKLVSRDIKRQDEWQHASVKDPFVSDADIVKCTPVTFEDRAAAEQNELVLNHQFTRQFNRYKFMTNAIKLFYAEGTVICKTSWYYEDEEENVEIPVYELDPNTFDPVQTGTKIVKRLKVIANRPDATLCRIEDTYMDPTAEGDIDKAQFMIHRYESDLSTLKKAKKYKNLHKIRHLDKSSNDADFEPSRDQHDGSEFEFMDNPRRKIIVYEYWGNYDIEGTGIAIPVVGTWVNDILIQLESNPYPDQKIPFLILANNSIPFHLYGEANAELVGDNQKVNTAIKRGILDNMANSNNAQKGVRVGSMDPLNERRFLNGKNFNFNGSSADFYEGNYNAIPPSVFSVMEMTNNETESMLGVKAFSGGIQGASLGSTAKAAGGVLDAVSVRRLDIVRNIAENLIKPLMRKWTAYNAVFLDKKEVIRITNDEFVEVDRNNLTGSIDIQIEVSTSESNSAKAQELSFLLQTLGQGMDQGMKNLLMGQIAKLNKMPDLAKQLEEYEPQPDPFVEKMKMLEMEKLQSEIDERKSRTMENMIDLELKKANTQLALAKTRELGSNTDLKDQEFTQNADGTAFDEEIAKKAFDHRAATDLENTKQRLTPN